MRPLTLHASALNDEEYEVYTASLRDLAWMEDGGDVVRDDRYYEDIRISLREMRGWLRGRYAGITPGTIDSVLRFFSPELNQGEMLSGGQVFAVMRLVTHAQNGREIDRALGFVQAYPKQQNIASSSNPFAIKSAPAQSSDPSFRLPPLPPRKFPPPPRHSSALVAPPARKSTSPSRTLSPPFISSTPSAPPALPPKQSAHVMSTLMKQSLRASKVGQTLKKAEEQLEQERVLQVLKSSSLVSGTNVLNRNRSLSPTRLTVSSGSEDGAKAPPLPKRRGTNAGRVSPPLSISSLEQVALATTTPQPPFLGRQNTDSRPLPDPGSYTHPRPPPFLPMASTTTVTRGSSFQQTSATRAYSEFPNMDTNIHNRPPPPVPHATSPQRSPRQAYTELPGPVATATRPPPPISPFFVMAASSPPHHSPTRTYSELPGTNTHPRGPPPTHPDRKPAHFSYNPPPSSQSHSPSSSTAPAPSSPTLSAFSDAASSSHLACKVSTTESSPTSRVFRSKSLHYPSPSPSPSGKSPPVAPPRRKRPESVQVLPNHGSGRFDGLFLGQDDGDGPGSVSLSRQSSLSRSPAHVQVHRRSSLSVSSTPQSTGGEPPTMAFPLSKIALSLQPKFEALQLQPRLEKARYKAEAGLSKRGYFKADGGEGLLGAEARDGGGDGHEQDRPRPGRVGTGGVAARRREWDERGRRVDWIQHRKDFDPPGVDPTNGDDANIEYDSDAGKELRAKLGADDSEEENERERRKWGRETNERWGGTERDALKWPVSEGEGWRLL